MRRAADIRSGKVPAIRHDRWERVVAELHRIYARVSLRNGNTSGASNDAHHATLTEADRRAALAEQEAALWRATAEVLRLDRAICREQKQRGGAMGGFSGDHYRALRLLSSYPNGCSERLMVWNGVSVETMVDLIRGQRPGCGRNYKRHNLREPSYSILCGEIKLLIDGFRGQGLPAIDFSHVDLSGSKQCPE